MFARHMKYLIAFAVAVLVLWAYALRHATPKSPIPGWVEAVGAGAIASGSTLAMIFGFIALVLASINIFGGFMVTSRMLAMYKKKEK